MGHTSEYAVENMFIDRLESLGYQFVKMNSYDDVLENFVHSLQNSMKKSWRKKVTLHHFRMLSSIAL